jgi:hypothetical protein
MNKNNKMDTFIIKLVITILALQLILAITGFYG